jgi:hypothetical protein
LLHELSVGIRGQEAKGCALRIRRLTDGFNMGLKLFPAGKYLNRHSNSLAAKRPIIYDQQYAFHIDTSVATERLPKSAEFCASYQGVDERGFALWPPAFQRRCPWRMPVKGGAKGSSDWNWELSSYSRMTDARAQGGRNPRKLALAAMGQMPSLAA